MSVFWDGLSETEVHLFGLLQGGGTKATETFHYFQSLRSITNRHVTQGYVRKTKPMNNSQN